MSNIKFNFKLFFFIVSFIGLSIIFYSQNSDNVAYANPNAFKITVKTDNTGTSGNNQFAIPTTGAGYNYNVDCDGDGTDEHTNQTGSVTCVYPSAGTYQIWITGTFPRIYFNNTGDRLKLLSIDQWGSIAWASMEGAFHGCSNMVLNATDTLRIYLV